MTSAEQERAKVVACGGCGAKSERERCIGCFHDFGTSTSEWVRSHLAPLAKTGQ